MINLLLQCLKKASIDGYEVNYTKEKSSQLFYVLDKLETFRVSDNNTIKVTIYNHHDNYLGSSKFIVNSADNENSIETKIVNAYQKASLINNPYYSLTQPDNKPVTQPNCYNDKDLNQLTLDFAQAIYDVKHEDNVWISSSEVFANSIETYFYNSNNVQLNYKKTYVEVETIATSKNDKGEEFEVYFDQKNTLKTPQEFSKDIQQLLNNAINRANAKKLDTSNLSQCNILIHDEMLSMLMHNFADQLSYMANFYHMNHYQVNDEIAPYKLDLSLIPNHDNVVTSRPFDNNGILLKDVDVIKDGQALQLQGDLRFGQYLKQDNISGVTPIVKLSTENTYNNIDNYIEVITFSSPQLISESGYFGGEVRLALYHHNGVVEPVSAFSVSGNIYQDIKNASFSNKQVNLTDYVGPDGILFKNMSVH